MKFQMIESPVTLRAYHRLAHLWFEAEIKVILWEIKLKTGIMLGRMQKVLWKIHSRILDNVERTMTVDASKKNITANTYHPILYDYHCFPSSSSYVCTSVNFFQHKFACEVKAAEIMDRVLSLCYNASESQRNITFRREWCIYI